jgi:hypothetical protein
VCDGLLLLFRDLFSDLVFLLIMRVGNRSNE